MMKIIMRTHRYEDSRVLTTGPILLAAQSSHAWRVIAPSMPSMPCSMQTHIEAGVLVLLECLKHCGAPHSE